MLKGFNRKLQPIDMLTDIQVRAVHKAILDVLASTGVRFENLQALRDLKGCGCEVDFDSRRVCFPQYLVEEAIRRCPSSFRVRARESRCDLILDCDTVYFQNFPGMQTIDLETWEPRHPTLRDYEDLMIVLDALPNLHLISCYPYFGWEGVPSAMCIPEGVALKLQTSTKYQQICSSCYSDQFTIPIVKACGGEASLAITGTAPLTWNDDQLAATYRAVDSGFPIMVCQGTVTGATGPATIVGSAVTNLAAEISLVVLIQYLSEGTRVHIGSDTYPMNMKTGTPAFGQISCALVSQIENQMARHYAIPTRDTAPGPVSAKKPDFQAAYEKAVNGLASALSGSNIILMHGALCGEITAHPIMAVLCDDIAGMIGRYIEGVSVNDETIALDLIEKVGPIPGNFLNTTHTRQWWKKEQFLPRVADDLTYPEWMQSGKKDCIDHAKELMEEILATHKVSIPLTQSQLEEIRTILKEARVFYQESGLISDSEWELYADKVLTSRDYRYA